MEVTLPEGIRLFRAKVGYFGPTNKDNFIDPPKLSYFTGKPIKRPLFKRKVNKKEKTTGGHPSSGSGITECGGPSGPAKNNLPCNFFDHRPKDYFDLQITPKFVECIADATNRHAVP